MEWTIGVSLKSSHYSITPLLGQPIASRAARVAAGARVDFDRLAFLDE